MICPESSVSKTSWCADIMSLAVNSIAWYPVLAENDFVRASKKITSTAEARVSELGISLHFGPFFIFYDDYLCHFLRGFDTMTTCIGTTQKDMDWKCLVRHFADKEFDSQKKEQTPDQWHDISPIRPRKELPGSCGRQVTIETSIC
jgi:hypothetical protein